jgi:glycolate oxidase FAD binding subunit
MRLRHGAVRDLVIGMTFVRADGVVARSGGKVVKNVAGYDLAKLLTGSYGTLGIVTEVAFRLHPTPQARRWIDADVNSIRQAHQAVQAVVHSQLMTAAVELDWRDGKGRIAVQLEGHVDGLDATTGQLERILASDTRSSAQPPPWWGREPEPNAALLKVTHEIGALANVLEATERAQSDTAARGVLRGSPAVGTAVVAVDTPEAGRPSAGAVAAFLSLMRTQAPRFGGAVVVLDAPDEVRERLDMWGPTSGLDLMRSVKGRFDPRHILAPGRFVGGI